MTGHAGQVPLRVGVVGLEHYHVTGWVETLELFSDQLEIVALYDPNPAVGARLAPALSTRLCAPGSASATVACAWRLTSRPSLIAMP